MTPPRLDKVFRQHFHKRNKEIKDQYALISTLVRGKKPLEPIKKCKITIIRYSNRFLDWDNVVSSYKSFIDALVLSGVLKDDNYGITGPWDVTQEFMPLKISPPCTYLKIEEQGG